MKITFTTNQEMRRQLLALPTRRQGTVPSTHLVRLSFYDAPYVKNIDAYLKQFIKKTVVLCYLFLGGKDENDVCFYNTTTRKWMVVPFSRIEEIETDLPEYYPPRSHDPPPYVSDWPWSDTPMK